MSNSKLLNLKQLFYLSLAGFGLQIASTLEMNNTSGIFKFLGASDKQVGLLWLIPPISGLLIQPILGQLSDLTTTKYGRRVPYIFIGMVLSCISLFFLPFSYSLAVTTMLILVLNCSINAATEGMRALIGDITPKEQKPSAFAWQSVFGGIAAMLASLIPWFLDSLGIFIKNTNNLPITLKISLIVGSYVLFHTVWTMLRQIKESDFIAPALHEEVPANKFMLLFILFKELIANIVNMPSVIKRFFLIQIFTWSGMFCVWLYFTIAIAQHVFGLPTDADIQANPVYHQIMEKGVVETNISFGIYQAFSVLYVIILPRLARMFSPYKVHAVSLITGAVSLILIVFFREMWLIYIAMLGLGVFWGSLCTMPYAIISAEIPSEKMGTYLGIFNITITVPQIICGLFIGFIDQYIFLNHAIFAILLGGGLIMTAGILLFRQEGVDIVYYTRVWIMNIVRNSNRVFSYYRQRKENKNK